MVREKGQNVGLGIAEVLRKTTKTSAKKQKGMKIIHKDGKRKSR